MHDCFYKLSGLILIKPFTVDVYAFKLTHTVAPSNTSRTNIKLVNERHFHLDQIGGHPLTQYELTINNPSALGFSSEEEINRKRIRDIILAMNLVLREAAFSPAGLNLTPVRWSANEGISEQINVVLGMGQAEQLNESVVMHNLELIDKLDRHEKKRKKRAQKNLESALDHYESAFYRKGVSELDKISMFEDISIAIDKAIQWEKELGACDKDGVLHKITGVSKKRGEIWRQMYNRLHHTSRKLKEEREYKYMIQRQISGQIIPLRSAANTLLLNRLENIY
jgi:hypothetical protein